MLAFGYNTFRKFYPSGEMRRRKMLIEHHRINKIFDVGANDGGFVSELKKMGFTQKIYSFEPIKPVFEKLDQRFHNSQGWRGFNYALGDFDGSAEINISRNSYSSSLKDMLPRHVASAPESAYIDKEKIKVCKLDTVFADLYKKGDRILLKIDTQGFEKEVLTGAEQSLQFCFGVQLELSLTPLYSGQENYLQLISELENKGFYLQSIEAGHSDPRSGQLLQVDGIFFRSEDYEIPTFHQ